MGQQSTFARTLETFKVGACCVSQTRIHDPTSVTSVRGPATVSFLGFILRVSDDPVSSTCGQAGVGIAVSIRAERTLLG